MPTESLELSGDGQTELLGHLSVVQSVQIK